MKTRRYYALANIVYSGISILAGILRVLYSICALIAPSVFLNEAGQYKIFMPLWKRLFNAEMWAVNLFFKK